MANRQWVYRQLAQLRGASEVQGLAFSHGERLVAVGTRDDIRVFDCNSLEQVGSVPNHGDLFDFAFTPENGFLVCSLRGAEVWENDFKTRRVLLRMDKLVGRFTCARNGVFIACREPKQVSIHSYQEGKQLLAFSGSYGAAKFTATGNGIVLGGETLFGYKSSIYSLKTKKRLAVEKRQFYLPSCLNQCPTTDDLTLFWASGADLLIHNLRSYASHKSIPFPGTLVSHIDASFRGDILAASGGQSVSVMRLNGLSPTHSSEATFNSHVENLRLSPSGNVLVLVLNNGYVSLGRAG